MGGLEAPQQLVEGVKDLLGEAFADLVLEFAAVPQQGGEALFRWRRQQPCLAEQLSHRRADRPACGLAHVRDLEVHPA